MNYKLKENIQIKLDENRMNPSELERRAGLSASSIRKILLGNSLNPTLDTLSAISEVFNCTIDELIGKRVVSHEKNHAEDLAQDLPWNNDLIKSIINVTCDYLEEKNINKDFGEVIKLVANTYSYYVMKKSTVFDKDFHEWYMQQNLN